MIILTYSGWFLGEKRYFFDGSEANSTRCQCDRTSSCQLDQSCNCFASSKSRKELRDQGKITADWKLPILGFGYSAPDAVPSTTSELKVIVGDLICSGTHFDSFLVTLMHMYLIVTSKRFSVEDISQSNSINLIVISRGLSFNRVSGLFFITPCTFILRVSLTIFIHLQTPSILSLKGR